MKHPMLRKIGYGIASVALASALGAGTVVLMRSVPYQSIYENNTKYAKNKLNTRKNELQKQLPLIEQERVVCKEKAATKEDARSCEQSASARKSWFKSDVADAEKELKNANALEAREERGRKINDVSTGLIVFFSSIFSVLAGCFMDRHSKNSSGKSSVSIEVRGVA